MLEFYKFGFTVVEALTKITKFFFLPMNSPEFRTYLLASNIAQIETGGALGVQWLVNFLTQTFGDLTLAQCFLSAFLPIFFVVTMIKWVLPTS